MNKILSALAVTLIFLSLCQPVHAQKLYKWVDEDGNVSYQDTPPPNTAKSVEESELQRSQPEPAETVTTAQPVVVYTVEDCDACEVLVLRLRQLEIPFTQQSLLNKDIQAEILAVSDSITAPTLKIGATFVEDFSDANLVSQLRQAGLNPVLKPDSQSATDDNRADSPAGSDQPSTNPG
jgi:hypothetical protein